MSWVAWTGSRLTPQWAKFVWGGCGRTESQERRTKRSILVEAGGGPLSVVVAAANATIKLLHKTLESVVVERPVPSSLLCLDKGYDNPTGHKTALRYHYERTSA